MAVFQNWLRPAGASFEHLHKQLVAIDEVGAQNAAVLDRLREDPQVFNHAALDVAVAHDLVIAENEHAVMFAGFGHRYPTVEVYSTSPVGEPWRQDPAELRGMSDLHLRIVLERLSSRHGVEVVTGTPRIPYRETISSPAEGGVTWSATPWIVRTGTAISPRRPRTSKSASASHRRA